jgi:sec-independent protein translocase protein TatC
MAVALRRIGHEDRLSLVGHLDELRTRLVVSVAAILVAFGLCLWQNHTLLRIINKPLAQQTEKRVQAGRGPLGATFRLQQDGRAVAAQLEQVVTALSRPDSGVHTGARVALARVTPLLEGDVARLSRPAAGEQPVTLGIGEPFSSTVGVSLIFALILALPIVLYQLYGFLLPAFSPAQRRVATPLLLAIPALFAAGVAFGYLIVLPGAVRFLQNFNSDQFNVLVQASQYYHFAAVTLLASGLTFQVPVAILAATRAGVVTPRQLRRNRRWAVVACGALAALLPGDAVTLLLETVPLYLLFEASVLVAWIAERRARA